VSVWRLPRIVHSHRQSLTVAPPEAVLAPTGIVRRRRSRSFTTDSITVVLAQRDVDGLSPLALWRRMQRLSATRKGQEVFK
jgi:hypothetical protein